MAHSSAVGRPLRHLGFRQAGGGLRGVRGNEGLKALDADKASPADSVTFHLALADPIVDQSPARADILGCASWPEVAWSRESGGFIRLR